MARFFNRRPRHAQPTVHDVTTTEVNEKGGRHHRQGRQDRQDRRDKKNRLPFDVNTGNFNRRPSFGQWLKFTWLDIVTMACLGAVGLGVYNADPAPSRSFPITFQDGEIVYPEFAYPLRTEIVPIWEAALLASLIPIAVILLMQIRIRSFWDVNNAIIGLLYSLITAAVFQVFIKWLIGGLRPHFLAVCQPDISRVTAGGDGFRSLMFRPDVCTGDRNQINDSLESMPSGHSTAAWAGFLYLYYYLNAKLKVWANYHPAMWKLVVIYAPVLGAFLITGALTIDEFHNWYDCLAGAIIGSVMATSAYRMVYASVWDFRFNHIPLTRHTPFSYGAGEAGAGGFESSVWTRKAGWGWGEAYGGAPFDAAHNLRGAMAGFNNTIHDQDHHNSGHGRGQSLGRGHGHTTARDTTTGTTGSGLGGLGATTTTTTGPAYRHDDVEYNAATTMAGDRERGAVNPTSGLTSAAAPAATHLPGGTTNYDREYDRDYDHDYERGRGLGHGTGTGHGHGHGLGHEHGLGNGRYENGVTTTDPNGNVTSAYAPSDSRYRTHRKSLERKAVQPR